MQDILQPEEQRAHDKSLLNIFNEFEFLSELPFNDYPSGFCGNISMKLKRICEEVSAPLLLARLVAAGAIVKTEGQQGYKTTWQVVLKHKKTNNIVYFYDYKGGSSYGSNWPINSESFFRDVEEVLNALTNWKFPHPYDGCVVGEIA